MIDYFLRFALKEKVGTSRSGRDGVNGNIPAIREAVLTGLGVALLPDWLIRDDIRSGRLVRVLPNWRVKDLPMHVAYAAQRVLPVRVRSFVEFAVDYLTQVLRLEGAG